jgi:uncharacterized membrane protein
MNLNEQIDQNVEAVRELERRVDRALDPATLRFKKLSTRIGQPNFLRALIATIIIWMLINLFADRLGFKAFDPFPFAILQGLIGLSALMTSLIVLTGQNREAILEGQRAHLDLQLNLLAEQKITKLIALLEELRRDLPNVSNRHDQVAEGMQESANPEAILGAMDEQVRSA